MTNQQSAKMKRTDDERTHTKLGVVGTKGTFEMEHVHHVYSKRRQIVTENVLGYRHHRRHRIFLCSSSDSSHQSRTSITYYLTWFLFIAHANLPTRAYTHTHDQADMRLPSIQRRITTPISMHATHTYTCKLICNLCKRSAVFFACAFFLQHFRYLTGHSLLGDSIPSSSASSFVSISECDAMMCIRIETNVRPTHKWQ